MTFIKLNICVFALGDFVVCFACSFERQRCVLFYILFYSLHVFCVDLPIPTIDFRLFAPVPLTLESTNLCRTQGGEGTMEQLGRRIC